MNKEILLNGSIDDLDKYYDKFDIDSFQECAKYLIENRELDDDLLGFLSERVLLENTLNLIYRCKNNKEYLESILDHLSSVRDYFDDCNGLINFFLQNNNTIICSDRMLDILSIEETLSLRERKIKNINLIDSKIVNILTSTTNLEKIRIILDNLVKNKEVEKFKDILIESVIKNANDTNLTKSIEIIDEVCNIAGIKDDLKIQYFNQLNIDKEKILKYLFINLTNDNVDFSVEFMKTIPKKSYKLFSSNDNRFDNLTLENKYKFIREYFNLTLSHEKEKKGIHNIVDYLFTYNGIGIGRSDTLKFLKKELKSFKISDQNIDEYISLIDSKLFNSAEEVLDFFTNQIYNLSDENYEKLKNTNVKLLEKFEISKDNIEKLSEINIFSLLRYTSNAENVFEACRNTIFKDKNNILSIINSMSNFVIFDTLKGKEEFIYKAIVDMAAKNSFKIDHLLIPLANLLNLNSDKLLHNPTAHQITSHPKEDKVEINNYSKIDNNIKESFSNQIALEIDQELINKLNLINSDFKKEKNKMSTSDWLKDNFNNGVNQGLARTTISNLKKGIVAGVKASGADDVSVAILEQFLESKIGTALVSAAIGTGVHFLPIDKIQENERVQQIANKCMENATADGVTELADMAMQYIMPAIMQTLNAVSAQETPLQALTSGKLRVNPTIDKKVSDDEALLAQVENLEDARKKQNKK